MNKKLIALAIAGAFAAPVAMADNSNVVIYGEFAASVDSVAGGPFSTAAAGAASVAPTVTATTPSTGNTAAGSTSEERRWRVSSNNSFLGFKGTEDLGNGLSAIWVYEQSIAIDQQGKNDSAGSQVLSNQSHRQIFVGLNSQRMGALTLGIQESPFKTSTGPLDIFGQHTIADYRNIWGAVGGLFIPAGGATPTTPGPVLPLNASGGVNIASIRAPNSVMYTSPNMAGFTVKALAGAQNENGNNTVNITTNNPYYYAVNGTYANGPLFATLAYEDNKVVASNVNNIEYKNWRTGVGYSFAGFKVGLAFERIKGKGNGTATASQELRRSAWYLPVSYQFGNNTIKAAFTHAGKSNQTLGGTDKSGNDGAKQWTLGFDHAMSKRTNLYALYTQVRNDNNGSYAIGSAGTGIAGVLPTSYGADPKALSVGMIHKF